MTSPCCELSRPALLLCYACGTELLVTVHLVPGERDGWAVVLEGRTHQVWRDSHRMPHMQIGSA